LRNSIALLGTGYALTAPIHAEAGTEPANHPEKPDKPSKGYQESAHVRTYYEKVRF
jgi:hypothetical protein